MATLTKGSVSSNTVNAGYTGSIDSLYSFNLTPQKLSAVYDLYGPALGMFQWLYLAGQTVDLKSGSIKVIERGSLEKGVKLGTGGIAVTAAATDITFALDSSEYNSSNECYLAVGDTIFVPPNYLSGTVYRPAKYQVTSISGTAPSLTFTAKPLSSTPGIGTAVPAGTVLMVSGGNYARGSQGAGYKSRGWYEREFVTAIKRAAFLLEGGTTATERFTDTLKNGDPGFFTKASIEADFQLDSAINDEIFLGEKNTNNFSMATRSGTSSVRGTQGLWDHLIEGGMRQVYTAGSYAISDFDDIKELFRSQGVTSTKAFFGVGSALLKQIENSGLSFLNSYSGGSDLLDIYGQVGVEFKAVRKNGILTVVQELVNFDNPVKYGLDAYKWKNAGFIVPQERVTVRMNSVDGDQVVLDNIAIGFLKNNGEDRERIVKILPGVEGITGEKLAVSTYDELRGEMLSEFALIVNKRNQMAMVIPSDFAS